MATSRKAKEPQQSHPGAVFGVLIAASIVVTAALGSPGFILALVAMMVAGVAARPPELTGRRNAQNRPTPADETEAAQLDSYLLWKALSKNALAMGGTGLVPTKRIRLSWVMALGTGLVAWSLPSMVPVPQGFGVLGAVCALSCVLAADTTWRVSHHPDDPTEGVTLDDVRSRMTPQLAGAPLVAAILAALVVWATTLEWWGGRVWHPLAATVAAGVGTFVLACAATASLAVREKVLESWNWTWEAREEWKGRWASLKTDPAPRLVSHERYGETIRVETFEVPVALGQATMFIGKKADAQMLTVLPPGAKALCFPAANVDNQGAEVPGTKHPSRFRVIEFLDGEVPSLLAPETDTDVAELIFAYGVGMYCSVWSYIPPMLASVEKVSAEGSPNVWVAHWTTDPLTPSMQLMANDSANIIAYLGAAMIVDKREGTMFAGAIEDHSVEFTDALPMPPKWSDPGRYFSALMGEVEWDARWKQSLKASVSPPRPEFSIEDTQELATGQKVHYLPFVILQGLTPDDYYPVAGKLATTLRAAPFCAITSFPQDNDPSRGIRHPQAITVLWSDRPVPNSPAALSPGRSRTSRAEMWVLTGMVESAFESARLPRPQVTRVEALTKPAAGRRATNIWKITVCLYDTTLEDVRAKATKLASALSVPWMRVAKDERHERFIHIYAGAEPSKAKMASPAYESQVAALDWEQAFAETGVIGTGGLVPRLLDVERLPHNDKVQLLDFQLPSPLTLTSVRGRIDKLKSATGNMFLDVTQASRGANFIKMRACVEDPMPSRAGYDFEAIDALVAEGKGRIPFATGVDGEPVTWNVKNNPHILVGGTSGGGKSVTMQSMIAAAIANHWIIVIVDPMKGAADFQFAAPYAQAIASTLAEGAGVLDLVYQEVGRRRDVNAAHGVGNYRDLPPDIRPRHVLVVIDEFTSLTGADVVPKASDDLEVEAERQRIITSNTARARIGTIIGKLAREARSAGVSVILGTQKLSAKTLDTLPGASDLKTNLARILLGKATFGERASALRAPEKAPDLGESIPPGRGIYEPLEGSALIVQSWYDPGEQQFLAEQVASRGEPLAEGEAWDLSRFAAHENDGPMVREVDEADVVIDGGEISLDDLDLDLDDLGSLDLDEDIDLESETAAPAQTMAMDARVLVATPRPPLPEGVTFIDSAGVDDPVGFARNLAEEHPEVGRVVWIAQGMGLDAERVRLVLADVGTECTVLDEPPSADSLARALDILSRTEDDWDVPEPEPESNPQTAPAVPVEPDDDADVPEPGEAPQTPSAPPVEPDDDWDVPEPTAGVSVPETDDDWSASEPTAEPARPVEDFAPEMSVSKSNVVGRRARSALFEEE